MASDVHLPLTTATGPAGPADPSSAVEVELDFRRAGNAGPYCVSGWSVAEETETWSVGTTSTLLFCSRWRQPSRRSLS
jgi:hypothetical protein